jgi:hypothetical protein
MRPLVAISLLLLIGAASLAEARLGETPDQITARFGNGGPLAIIPSGPEKDLRQQIFEKQGFEIQVIFTDFSVGETYTASGKLNEDQIQALLAANNEGHGWKESQWGGDRYWTRDDGARAHLISNNQLEFKSKFLVDRETAWKQAQLPDVNGF